MRSIDKRLSIELASLRQQLWRYAGRDDIRARLQDGPPALPTDRLRWIDTLVMAADPLTKPMSDLFLQRILDTGRWNVSQPALGKELKARKSQQRQAKRAAERDGSGDDPAGTDEPDIGED